MPISVTASTGASGPVLKTPSSVPVPDGDDKAAAKPTPAATLHVSPVARQAAALHPKGLHIALPPRK